MHLERGAMVRPTPLVPQQFRVWLAKASKGSESSQGLRGGEKFSLRTCIEHTVRHGVGRNDIPQRIIQIVPFQQIVAFYAIPKHYLDVFC